MSALALEKTKIILCVVPCLRLSPKCLGEWEWEWEAGGRAGCHVTCSVE